jgi:predicted nucleic acid-binding protein
MIVDSTVLISLGLINQLDLIDTFKIPKKVYEEIETEFIKAILIKRDFKIINPSINSKRRALKILGDKFETGDSDLIAILLELPNSLIATDDKRLRNVCRSLGGRITGTLGILIYSVEKGKISKNKGIEILKNLDQTGFRISIELFNKVSTKIREI